MREVWYANATTIAGRSRRAPGGDAERGETQGRVSADSVRLAACRPGFPSRPDGHGLGLAGRLRAGPVPSDYLRQGEAVLRSKPCGGRHRQNLTQEPEKELLTPFLEQAAVGGVRVAAPLPAAEEAAVGRPLHHSVVYRAWHRQGWRKGAPRAKPPQAKEEAREALKKLPETVQEQIARSAVPGLPSRLLFQEEARFGRISDPRRCWAPARIRPEVSIQVVREYEYAFAAVSPHDGTLGHARYCPRLMPRP
jgi:transposase